MNRHKALVLLAVMQATKCVAAFAMTHAASAVAEADQGFS